MLLPIFESFANKEIVAGYSLASFDWWVDIFVILGAILILGSIYFFLVWDFGFWRFNQDDKEAFQKYRQASKKEKKQIAKASKGRVKRVIVWKRMKPWFIPTISFVLIVTLVAVPVLHAIWDVLGTTINGSPVDISDTETSRKTAAQAEENVVTIEEEGLVLLKNENNTLPLKANGNEKIKINIFGSCAYGLFYGNGGSGSFQTDGRVSSFPRTALKLEKALENEGFEINQNLFNMIKNYYESEGKTISVKESTYDIQCGYNKYKYSEIVNSKDPCSYEPPATAYTEKIFNELGGVSLLENAKSFSDVAIFCITRRGSEDEDMKYSELALKQNEIDAIKLLENNFGTVIILLNVPTVIEASFLNDEQIDAAIYMGHPGLTGTKAVAQALIGKINPSGQIGRAHV